MKKNFKKIAALLVAMTMIVSLAACTKGNEETNDPGTTQTDQNKTDPAKNDNTNPGSQPGTQAGTTPEPEKEWDPSEIRTIVWGTHWAQDLDPWLVDEVTGEYLMAESEREIRLAAEEEVMKELGVKIEYVQYDTMVTPLQSVMAGDPICDIALLWGGSEGTILQQNIIQPIDEFAYLFNEYEGMDWMLYDKMYGHNYLFSNVVRYIPRWPLCFNVTKLQAIDALKDKNGNTILPTTLFLNGEWTWSKFKEYLEIVDAYYANDDTVTAYTTNYIFSALSAAYSNGGGVYTSDGLVVNSKETKDAMAYIKDLYDSGLMTTDFNGEGTKPNWDVSCGTFRDGHTVFTDQADWLIGWSGGVASERDEAIGIVPWPRADRLSANDPDYKQAMTLGDSLCILKGVDKETTELAVRTAIVYTKAYYCAKFGLDDFSELHNDDALSNMAVEYGLDIYNKEYGSEIFDAFKYITENVQYGYDYKDILGIAGTWEDIFCYSHLGILGYASYDISVEQYLGKFTEVTDTISKSLSGTAAVNTNKPNVYAINGDSVPVVVPIGTSSNDIKFWQTWYAAEDPVGSEVDQNTLRIEFNHVEEKNNATPLYDDSMFNTPGFYNRCFKVYFTNASGIENYKTATIYVYDPGNKEKPTVTLVANPAKLQRNADVSAITWVNPATGFIASAVDADGVDISCNIDVDLSTLDTSAAGTYPVSITFTDFCGNATTVTVNVTVK